MGLGQQLNGYSGCLEGKCLLFHVCNGIAGSEDSRANSTSPQVGLAPAVGLFEVPGPLPQWSSFHPYTGWGIIWAGHTMKQELRAGGWMEWPALGIAPTVVHGGAPAGL